MDNSSEFLFTVTSTADCKNGVSVIARWPLNSALVHKHESVAAFRTENGLSYILTVHGYKNTGLSFDNVGDLDNTNVSTGIAY